MTADEIMAYRRAVPFRPFALKLKDGRRFIIRDFINIGRNERGSTIIVAAPHETFEKFAPGDIAEVKLLKAGKGREKRR